MQGKSKTRPIGITALSILFLFGAVAGFVSSASFLFPGSFLEPVWRFNPRAREGFAGIGAWAIVIMSIVCIFCALAAAGLWRGTRWGYWLAILLLTVNLTGDILNVVLGTQPAAIIGVPVAIAIFVFLRSNRVRRFFAKSTVIEYKN